MSSTLECPRCAAKLASGHVRAGVYAGTCPACNTALTFRLSHLFHRTAPQPVTSISFTLNGNPVTVENPDPLMTLNEYIRTVANLKGTKRSCAEGGCGACVVSLTQFDNIQQKYVTSSINSCLRPLCSVDGLAVTTIEALSNVRSGSYSALSTVLAEHSGTQCGFCSPGFVMAMHSLLAENPSPTAQQIETLFDGNICRCTGYRPILDAMQTFSSASADSGARADIEDLAAIAAQPCAKLACAKACKAPSARDAHVVLSAGEYVWMRPLTLAELFDDMLLHALEDVKLVFGNTSTGIFKDDPSRVFLDISNIAELQQVSATASALTVGAAVSITNLIDILGSYTGLSSSFTVLADHLSIIANTNVRNAGCWAGNLMMTHNNADFPSDIFTIMAATNATLTIASSPVTTQVYDLFSFLQLDMKGKVIVSISIPALTANQKLMTFKIMPRHINAHAYVNAGFLMAVDANSNVIGTPRFVYGGIGPYGVLAANTAQSLVGANLSNSAALAQAMVALQAELKPDQPPVAASATYRVSLACGLLYKFYLSFLPNANPRVQSAAVPFVRPISSGTSSFTTNPSLYPVTQPLPKISAVLQTSGLAQYTDDLPIVPGTLFAAFAMSTVASATLLTVETLAARNAPGVARVLVASDLTGRNSFNIPGSATESLMVGELEEIKYAGQSIAIVLAQTQAQADAAAKLVTATYANVQTPILTIAQARADPKRGIFDIPIESLTYGDVNAALATAPFVISGTIDCGGQYHFHMETQTSIAIPQEDGGLQIYCSTQAPDYVNLAVSHATKIHHGKVRVTARRAGGAYGGKITRCLLSAVATSVAAVLTGCPVRTVVNLNSNMALLGKRNPWETDYTVGFDANGKLLAIKLNYFIDCGSEIIADNLITGSMAKHACDGAYYCPNWEVTPTFIRTNTPPNTSTRAPGCLPAIFSIENIIEHVAQSLQVVPSVVRFANLYQQGQMTPYLQPMTYCNLSSQWTSFVASTSYNARQSAISAFNQANRWRKRAISIAPNKYGIAWGSNFFSILISVSAADGSVSISSGGSEMGQGLDTKVTQATAFALGVPITQVFYVATDSFINPNNAPTGGSVGSEIAVAAALDACSKLNARLQPVRASMGNPTWQELVAQCYNLSIDLSVKGGSAPANGDGNPFAYNSFGIVVNEVEIDVLTGEVQILQTDILFDCGQSLNPAIDIGQVQGGYLMGCGYFLTEFLLNDPTSGQLLTNGTWEYKPPSVLDIPIVFNTTLLPDAPNPLGILSSKASGEPAVCMAANVLFAVKTAINAALGELGPLPAWSPLNGPATVDAIQQACGVNPTEFFF
eukprot:m.803689 g.803689  ORF g.803689 m.803689 type:complete len:1324 (-) comp59281_c0_seq1:203-4174(-)